MASDDPPSRDAEHGDPRIGRVIDGRYRIAGVVGGGGMGVVYRAEHVAIGRPVALKLIHPGLGRDSDFARRFEREAVAMGRLDHPNCAAVSDFGELEDGTLYLVMELLVGEPLSATLDREGRLPPSRALAITRHILRGLRHAHAADVVHRDLKPENIVLVRRDDEPDFAKILDFGIAKLVGPSETEGADKLTQTGFAIGTPKYIAPELAFGDPVTPSADLYSTAVLLYEMITGRLPFEAEDPAALLTMHAAKPVPAFADVAPDLEVPSGLEELVRRGMAKRRSERIASADEFLASVEALLAAPPAPEAQGGRAASAPIAPAPSAVAPPPVAADPGPSGPSESAPDTASPQGGAPDGWPPVPREPEPAPVSQPTFGAGVPPAPEGGFPPPHAPAEGEFPPPHASPDAGFPPPHNAAEAGEPADSQAARASSHAGEARAPSEVSPRAPPEPPGPGVGPIAQPTEIVAAPNRIGWRGPVKILAAFIAVCVLVGLVATSCPSREERLQEYTELLREGETCEERRRAVENLRALGDARAIEPLRQARHRMRGGVAGIGQSNENACLKEEAEEAIRALRDQ